MSYLGLIYVILWRKIRIETIYNEQNGNRNVFLRGAYHRGEKAGILYCIIKGMCKEYNAVVNLKTKIPSFVLFFDGF